MLLPLLIIASCQPGVNDVTFSGGTLDGLARSDGGLGLSGGSSASPPDAGIAFQPGSRFGFYESPVLDARFLTSWTALTWSMSSPAGLPLPDDGGAENFLYDSIDMTGNVALFHFDELSWTGTPGEVRDSSGFRNHGSVDGGALTKGLMGRAGSFGGSDCVLVPDAPSLNPTDAVTLATWFYSRAPDGSAQGLIAKREDYALPSAYTLFLWTAGNLWFDLDTENDRTSGTTVIQGGQWHHAALVFDGTALPLKRATLYVDGVQDVQVNETSITLPPNAADLAIGCLPNPSAGPNQGFNGLIDEAAIWRRALSMQEIEALYRRGSTRLLFQVRSCGDATCSTNPPWVGPGGVVGAFFTGLGGPLTLPDNQFVQYRVWMQNDTELRSVDLRGFEVGTACSAADAGDDDAGAQTDAGRDEDAGVINARALRVGCGCDATDGLAVVALLLVARRRKAT